MWGPAIRRTIQTYRHRKAGERSRKFYYKPAGGIVRTGFTISRYWNQHPTWFFSLDAQLQAELIADYKLSHMKTPDIEKNKKRFQIERVKSQHERFKRRGAE